MITKPTRLAALLLGTLLLSACETMSVAPVGNLVGQLGGGSTGHNTLDVVHDVVSGATAAFKDYTAAEQRTLGTEFSAVLLGARPLLRNERVQRYVNQVGVWVASQADKPLDKEGKPIQFAWRFGVIDTDAVNAYATPGGYIFITLGLLKQLESEAELAGVLAHEIAHVTRGHYLAALKKGGFAQIAGGVVKAKAGSGVVSSAMVNAVRNIYSRGLDQSDEFQADRLGVLYAARAGYSPQGLPNVLRLYAASGSKGDANYSILFSTHPAPTERSQRIEPMVSSQLAQADTTENEKRFLAMRRQLR
ncbi:MULTISPECIES: M48 family metalloprotease [Giesbergeria]|uniref:M48 family metalloprotease n=1 Tax=Giesbergeria sinuosa TaxID=80883 RepID=A0ABV9QE20_9BURK